MIRTDEKILFITAEKKMKEEMALLLHMLQRHFNNLTEITTDNHEKILKMVNHEKEDLDFIVLDHEVYKGVRLLENILAINPQFKILILSGSVHCSEVQGCDFCQERYNKIRLLTPANKKDIVECIRNFDMYKCEYKQKCEEIKDNNFLF